MPALLTVEQVAELLGVKRSFVYSLIRKRLINYYRLGGASNSAVRISRTDVDDYLESTRVSRISK